ncbi:hypothetical protein KEM60_00485 [Austwickia sp. TVS 96-490-7B]|nr:hypothetical protein [Austwickia sp. TVS 96-490-7B]
MIVSWVGQGKLAFVWRSNEQNLWMALGEVT